MSLTSSPRNVRPEDRRRSGVDSLALLGWADTRPGCFRSEGFAEDLSGPGDGQAPEAAAGGRRLRRAAATLPLLGLTLVGVLGAFSR